MSDDIEEIDEGLRKLSPEEVENIVGDIDREELRDLAREGSSQLQNYLFDRWMEEQDIQKFEGLEEYHELMYIKDSKFPVLAAQKLEKSSDTSEREVYNVELLKDAVKANASLKVEKGFYNLAGELFDKYSETLENADCSYKDLVSWLESEYSLEGEELEKLNKRSHKFLD
ncbi:MAG: hypothetical protein SVV03_01150 [Candidatus Nanohaloarchaea archaeon]|nr:hypothetical protein [Candidatus Nanohaloarchaea archaeon]